MDSESFIRCPKHTARERPPSLRTTPLQHRHNRLHYNPIMLTFGELHHSTKALRLSTTSLAATPQACETWACVSWLAGRHGTIFIKMPSHLTETLTRIDFPVTHAAKNKTVTVRKRPISGHKFEEKQQRLQTSGETENSKGYALFSWYLGRIYREENCME
ncbi:hypothetical protein AMTR_s00009p00246810 [Amborella trichopoda]|uniref:Uncharacterized protein n=1 Tax=Amborella trichopoda TaxID=13333 RepID=W1NGW6_AMBTC|nr:hypothetical protein AMTR_s00009p00246810 [Amborella trichopoda]